MNAMHQAAMHVSKGALACLIAALLGATPAWSQFKGRPAQVEAREGDIKSTGLVAQFAEGLICPAIASGFGSPERFNSSSRLAERFGGMHGGIDLSLPEGTELLAVADGKVISRGEGGMLEGIYLWLQHSPEDTGLRQWTYTKYQHLSRLPNLQEGQRVAAGQAIALSGKSGTVGPAFGPAGYPHLHLSLFAGPSGEFEKFGDSGSRIRTVDGRLVDPLLLYLEGAGADPLAPLSADRRQVRVSAVTADGQRRPAGAKVVWPVRCESRAP